MQTSAAMLASRRPAATSWAWERKNGRLGRMSATSRSGGSSAPAAAGSGIRPLPRCGVRIATRSVWQAPEGVVSRLLLSGRGEETGLPAAEPALVADQEPEHHRDPRVLARDLVRLRQVLRLLGPAHAEEPVGRPGLVAVLRNAELLVAVEPAQELGQVADVAEDDARLVAPLGLCRRGIRRPAVVRMVRVGVE